MKILFVISCLSYGGAEKNLMILANYFLKNHKVAICNFNEKDTLQKVDEDIRYYEQSRWIPTGKKFDWIGMRKSQFKFLKASCKDFCPDVIVSFLPMPNTLAVLCGKKLHIRVVISERADPYQSFSKMDKINHFIYGFADGAVFQTDGAKAFYQKKLQKKGTVIPNPVILPKNCPIHDYASAKKEIVCVSRFENKQKRQDLAIKAMAIIHQKYPSYKMVFWGDGDDLESSKAMVTQMELDEVIEFAGVTYNVHEDINRSEIYLLTSDYEGIPNTLIEAMSIGMPCVSTDCSPGGARMLLGNDEFGLVVPCGDEQAIADAVMSLLRDTLKANELGINASKSIARFSYDEMMEKWNEYIKKIANN